MYLYLIMLLQDDLTYTFANIDSEDRSQFFLESTSGKLFLRRAFTNIKATYTFSVRAADQYSRSCVIFVSISVLSDTPPMFIGGPYTVTVLENSQPGSSVVMVTAQDSDLRVHIFSSYFYSSLSDILLNTSTIV